MDSRRQPGSRPAGAEAQPHDHQARRRIEAEHQNLGRLVARLEESREIEATIAVLAELHQALGEHFETEESEDGLHRAIGHTAPEKEHALTDLFAQHREFMLRIKRLRQRADGCLRSLQETFDDGQQLAADLKAHEVQETELFLDAIYSEHGGGD